jgi:prepilin-type N-terminal cleavage/methylation domain-containing protein
MRLSCLRGNRGFTLLEVIIVVALIGLLAVGTTVSLISYIPNLRLKSATQDIGSQIQKARLEAIRQNSRCFIEFYRSEGTTVYSPFVWLEKSDPRNNQFDPTTDDLLFRMPVEENDPGEWSLADYRGIKFNKNESGNGVSIPPDPANANRIFFSLNSRGISDKPGSFHLVNSRDRTREIVVTLGGAVRVR